MGSITEGDSLNKIDPSEAFKVRSTNAYSLPNGKEPRLGGKLREKAAWVDESACIGCRYCTNVACNTFVMEPIFGRSRVVRQDGDSTDIIQEAIETCPVDCIHWVEFEDLEELRLELEEMEIQPLGFPQKSSKRLKPRWN